MPYSPSGRRTTSLQSPQQSPRTNREHQLPITDMLRPYIAQTPFNNINRREPKMRWTEYLRRAVASLMAAPRCALSRRPPIHSANRP